MKFHPVTQAMRCAAFVACFALIANWESASAQTANTVSLSIESSRPSAPATRIAENEAPVIDGDLSDPVWAKATIIDNFTQVDPDNGAKISERTIVRVAYDSVNFYVSVYAYDTEPDKIIATVKTRDGQMPKDDFVRFTLDPNMTRRDAYAFEINPLGGRVDALIQNNGSYLINWNMIWQGNARRVADGWTAEAAIPFRNLSFDQARTEWGFDFFRQIRRKSEKARWAPTPPTVSDLDVSLAGTLTGMSGMNQGAGLDIQVYGGLRYKHQAQGTEDNDLTFRPSGNLYYKITPGLTGTLTVNTDFSDAPLDKRRVNTTRFGLFDPETRQFFLQDAASFEFGGRALGDRAENGKPFVSRNIGLVFGQPAAIIGGAKLSGEFENIGIGALVAQTAGTDTTDGQRLALARLTVPVLGESKMGMIVTHGDPTGLTDNTVGGADFQYRNSDLFGTRKRLLADFFYERSFSSTAGNDEAFGASLAYPNEPWGGDFNFKQVGQNFTPTLGFVNRRGIDSYRGRLTHRDRYTDSYWRWFEPGVEYDIVTGLDGTEQTHEINMVVKLHSVDDDQAEAQIQSIYENVDAPFFLPGKVLVPAGEYSKHRFALELETSSGRPWSISWRGNCCEFYDGTNAASDLTLDYHPSETFSIKIQHTMNLIDVSGGSVDIHVLSLEPTVNFTPDMQLLTQIQYDNISKRLQFLARYRWEYEPGSELFVSLGENSLVQGPFFSPHYQSNNTQAAIRIGHTFQF